MIVAYTANDVRRALSAVPHPIGFVPTMGALHRGHTTLFDTARSSCRTLVTSIFVNALQFDKREDLDLYPRTVEQDLEMCREHGVDVVYLPEHQTMYPAGFSTVVSIGRLARILEGAHRAGHFDGVATVVTKLLSAVRPDVAYFGQKDLQQVSVIRRLTADLDLGVDIRMEATVRDDDGLALSSRNIRLSPSGRTLALAIPRSLEIARTRAQTGGADPGTITKEMNDSLTESGLTIDYAIVLEADTFEESTKVTERSVAVIAASVDGVRLIDNVFLLGDPSVPSDHAEPLGRLD